VGSDPLAARLRRLRPRCHVFAHSHFSWDQRLGDGTRYVQAPLCYPNERQRRGKSIQLGAAAAEWRRAQEGGADCTPGAEAAEAIEGLPALLYVARYSGGGESGGSQASGSGSSDGGSGGGISAWSSKWAPSLEGAWSEYYNTGNERQPWVTEMAPWVAPRFERRRQRMERDGGHKVGEAGKDADVTVSILETEEVAD
jgi:hypothetical protein